MVFGRRKSSAQPDPVQDDIDARQRNRLSKPLTNKSTTNLIAQDALSRSESNSNSTDGATTPLSPQMTDGEKRQHIRSHLFDSEVNGSTSASPPKPVKNGSSNWSGVAYMVSKFEANAAGSKPSQSPSVSPNKAKRPISALFAKRRSSGTDTTFIKNNERVASLRVDPPQQSPASSLDQLFDVPPVPTSRRASFTPGSATRVGSRLSSLKTEIKPETEKQAILEENDLSFDEGDDEDWLPPPQLPRTETPQGLDYTHLGGLRLGSLHVVNRSASPATSVLSKHLLARVATPRVASSEYGDSEYGDPMPYPQSTELQTPRPQRDFSWASNRSSRFPTLEKIIPPPMANSAAHTPDRTSAMAAAYMAELPPSPYTIHRSSSLSSLHLDSDLKRRASHESLQKSPSTESLQRSPSFGGSLRRSSSSLSSISVPSSTGSILRTTTKRTGVEDALFDDEAMGKSTEPDRSTLDSWHSPVDPVFDREEAFSSAVEFQAPKSPERLHPPARNDKNDSGYSSNNSVRSASGAEKVAEMPVLARTEDRNLAAKFFRPILKSRKTAPPAVPTFSNIRPPPPRPLMTSLSDTPKVDTDKPKTRKKLQKRSIWKRQKEITVQSVNAPDESGIPPIPVEIQSNLRIRSQEVPELEQTYKSMHHVRNQPSVSNMYPPVTEIRFPSPTPLAEIPNRRRSWRGRPKEQKISSRPSSGISQQEAMSIINDFGTVASSLGGSPYDMASGEYGTRDQSRTRTNPSDISTSVNRPKSMMDDHTAAEVARVRNKASTGRHSWNERRASFNDRGGIPGKNLRPSSFCYEAPPLPPMPSPEILQKRSSYISSPAPPPPPHSPRPSYVDVADDFEDMCLAPPPPSHSPRPMEVVEDPWAAQAASWKEKRQSAVTAMKRHSWNSTQHQVPPPEEEPLYPTIPLRGHDRQYGPYSLPQSYPVQQVDYSYAQYEESQHSRPGSQHSRPGSQHSRPGSQHSRPVSQQRNGRYGVSQYSREPSPHYDQYQAPQQHRDRSQQRYDHYAEPQYHRDRSQQRYEQSPRPRSNYYPPNSYDSNYRPLPQPAPRPYDSPRPRSQAGSFRSIASSLAEELHPAEQERPQPSPQFGRYSGGMGYGYERDAGFGGSAGTRSVSGKADALHKGIPLRSSHGVDLGDIPVMGVLKRVQ